MIPRSYVCLATFGAGRWKGECFFSRTKIRVQKLFAFLVPALIAPSRALTQQGRFGATTISRVISKGVGLEDIRNKRACRREIVSAAMYAFFCQPVPGCDLVSRLPALPPHSIPEPDFHTMARWMEISTTEKNTPQPPEVRSST